MPQKNNKPKPKYTKEDSLSFNKYEQMLEMHGSAISDKFPKQFLDDYHKFKGGKKTPPDLSTSRPSPGQVEKTSPGFVRKRRNELSEFIVDKTSRLEKLQESYDRDYEAFQKDSTRYEDALSSIDMLQAEWDASEKGDWSPRALLNIYPEDSSMGILQSSLDDLRGEAQTLRSSLYTTDRRAGVYSKQDILKQREGGLKRMSDEIERKKEQFNAIELFLNQEKEK